MINSGNLKLDTICNCQTITFGRVSITRTRGFLQQKGKNLELKQRWCPWWWCWNIFCFFNLKACEIIQECWAISYHWGSGSTFLLLALQHRTWFMLCIFICVAQMVKHNILSASFSQVSEGSRSKARRIPTSWDWLVWNLVQMLEAQDRITMFCCIAWTFSWCSLPLGMLNHFFPNIFKWAVSHFVVFWSVSSYLKKMCLYLLSQQRTRGEKSLIICHIMSQ